MTVDGTKSQFKAPLRNRLSGGQSVGFVAESRKATARGVVQSAAHVNLPAPAWAGAVTRLPGTRGTVAPVGPRKPPKWAGAGKFVAGQICQEEAPIPSSISPL